MWSLRLRLEAQGSAQQVLISGGTLDRKNSHFSRSLIALALLCPLAALAQQEHRVSIKLEQLADRADHVVRVRIETRNESQDTIEVERGTTPIWDFTITAVGPDNKAAKLTKTGERFRSLPPNGSRVSISLPPQQSVSTELDLSDHVDFSQSGKYQVTVARRFDTLNNELATSNTIVVEMP